MDQADIIIKKIKTLGFPRLEIVTNEPKRYVANLISFSNVQCFPRSEQEWNDLGITASGFNLTWRTGFEVHVDQIIDSAEFTHEIKLRA